MQLRRRNDATGLTARPVFTSKLLSSCKGLFEDDLPTPHQLLLYGTNVVLDPAALRDALDISPRCSPLLEVKLLPNTHAAYRPLSRGVFAAAPIPAGTVLGEYTGACSLTYEFDARYACQGHASDYAIASETIPALPFTVDAREHGNDMRFMNDYRGLQDAENSGFATVVDLSTCTPHVLVVTRVAMQLGAEVMLDYGGPYWSGRLA